MVTPPAPNTLAYSSVNPGSRAAGIALRILAFRWLDIRTVSAGPYQASRRALPPATGEDARFVSARQPRADAHGKRIRSAARRCASAWQPSMGSAHEGKSKKPWCTGECLQQGDDTAAE